jgi:hypothetical protein
MGSQARATAAGKGHADNPVDGCAYFSYRIEFVFVVRNAAGEREMVMTPPRAGGYPVI